jgi:uncharacterized membrane protein
MFWTHLVSIVIINAYCTGDRYISSSCFYFNQLAYPGVIFTLLFFCACSFYATPCFNYSRSRGPLVTCCIII